MMTPETPEIVVYVLVETDWDGAMVCGVFRSTEDARASLPGVTWQNETSGQRPDPGNPNSTPFSVHIEDHVLR